MSLTDAQAEAIMQQDRDYLSKWSDLREYTKRVFALGVASAKRTQIIEKIDAKEPK